MNQQTALHWLVAASVALWGATCTVAAPATPSPEGQPSEALCTAHYDQQSRQLAKRLVESPDAAKASLRAELQQVLRRGTAFVGHAYLDSTPEAQAKAQLEQAKLELARLTAAELAQIEPSCARMAAALRKDAPGWQRLIADRLADRRAERLLTSAQAEADKKKVPSP